MTRKNYRVNALFQNIQEIYRNRLKKCDIQSTAYFTLHIRPNFLYSARFEILDQIDQSQQVFESGKRSPSGEDHKRIGLSDIGPTRWEKGRLPIFGIIKNSPLAPTQPAINKPKLPSLRALWSVSLGANPKATPIPVEDLQKR